MLKFCNNIFNYKTIKNQFLNAYPFLLPESLLKLLKRHSLGSGQYGFVGGYSLFCYFPYRSTTRQTVFFRVKINLWSVVVCCSKSSRNNYVRSCSRFSNNSSSSSDRCHLSSSKRTQWISSRWPPTNSAWCDLPCPTTLASGISYNRYTSIPLDSNYSKLLIIHSHQISSNIPPSAIPHDRTQYLSEPNMAG